MDAENLNADLQELGAAAVLIDAQPAAAVAAVAAQNNAIAQGQAAEWVGLIVGLGVPAAAVLAPNWAIKPAELAALGEAWAPVMMEYFPEGVGGMGPWVGAIAVTAMFAAPRIGIPRHAPPENAEGAGHE